jgi:cytochrome P450
MARVATHDTTLGDRHVKEGERVVLTFPAANRDPAVFENPEEVIIDREKNRHIAFGAGIHRCLGSNLARMEMNVAIEEFLKMVPEFELEDPAAVTWAGGQVRGPRNLPVTFPVRRPL